MSVIRATGAAGRARVQSLSREFACMSESCCGLSIVLFDGSGDVFACQLFHMYVSNSLLGLHWPSGRCGNRPPT